jgi:hypothetical protein
MNIYIIHKHLSILNKERIIRYFGVSLNRHPQHGIEKIPVKGTDIHDPGHNELILGNLIKKTNLTSYRVKCNVPIPKYFNPIR